ncbi:hypothetical protein [Pseudosulfitobacter koreensis]|uniref:Uncharacterized protein n=1 Tax=Pseudosulfitobacter koreensis TaxID=2968472 RepID=A0ABT1Z2H4_9RHOB|nr:hypothetical protein [Pseudosulfitobacter koreense]MCR8827332.1 hypothetical protein [Pseudosulfitobacter koreense]
MVMEIYRKIPHTQLIGRLRARLGRRNMIEGTSRPSAGTNLLPVRIILKVQKCEGRRDLGHAKRFTQLVEIAVGCEITVLQFQTQEQ